MIIKNNRIEPVDTELASDNVLVFDFKNKTFLAKIFYKIFKIFGQPLRSREFITKGRLDDKDIVRYIYDQQKILEVFANKTPKYLILGSDAMRELQIRTTYGTFVVGDSFDESYIKKRFAGLKVVLMPSMTGVLVLHDICEDSEDDPGSSNMVTGISGVRGI